METGEFFTAEEKRLLFVLYRKLLQLSGETLHKGDCRKLKTHLVNSIQNNRIQRDIFGLNPIIKDMQTAVIVAEEIGMRRASILGLMLHDSVRCGTCTAEEVERNYGEDVAGIIRGLIRTLRQKPHHRVGELPQPAAVLCRGHARYPHHDCRPREHHAPDKGVQERRGTQAGGQ